jgi:mono/diheme cytochrome c family protein
VFLPVATEAARANPPSAGAIVPGLGSSQLDDKLSGLVLLEELNCVACHATNASIRDTSKKAPRLSAVGARVNPHYLEQFIRAPHATKPGTTMPEVMSHLPADQRGRTAQAIAHYLLSLADSRPFELEVIDTVAAERGNELFHTVGCVACHSPRNEQGEEILAEGSAPLGSLEKKYNTRSLAEFLRAPHKARPSGRMPDLKLSAAEAGQIANYLLRKTQTPGHLRYTLLSGRVWEGLEVNVAKERSGHVDDFELKNLGQTPGNSAIIYEGYLNLDRAGDYSFFLEMNGGQLRLNDQEVAQLEPSSRRGVKPVQAQVKLPAGKSKLKLVYIHAGKEPGLRFEIQGPGLARQPIPAARLSVSETPIAPLEPYPVDNALVAEGRREFAGLGCIQCHDDIKGETGAVRSAPVLADLDAERGCLSDDDGHWPRFHLSADQQKLIRAALAGVETIELNQQAIVEKSLATFNCIACHDRAGLGGVSPERNEYFVGDKKELGNEGRIPPPLTHVGAKLQTHWIKEVMLGGKEQREYLAVRMPQFGEANVGHLVELFEQVDSLEQVEFPKIEDVAEYKQAGHQLIGVTGLSCIACHDFNGQKAEGPGAMEMIHSTERLKKDWFYLFMLNPSRFRARTVMPTAWPGGHSFKKDILGGDTKKQIESIWVYLSDGARAKNPIGLSRKSPELRVTDVAVICRGRGNAGYRGIAVGYPERVSLAFDSQEMNLRLLWKGDFARADEGRFSARGTDQVSFPQGIPFHRLKSLEDNWPYKRKTDYLFPQDHGYQFKGYYLDEKRRPTFRYRYGEVEVEDFFEDLLDDKQVAYFRRTFTFTAPSDQAQFYFRAAAGRDIKKLEPAGQGGAVRSYKADRLNVAIQGPQQAIIRDGEPKELLIPLKLPQGKSTLVLEYRW